MTKLTELTARESFGEGRPGMMTRSGNYDMVTRSAFNPATKKPQVFYSGNAVADDTTNPDNAIPPKAGLNRLTGVIVSNNTGTNFHLDKRGYDRFEPLQVLTSGGVKVIVHDDVAAGDLVGIQINASGNKIPGNFVKATASTDVFNTGLRFSKAVTAGDLYDLDFTGGFTAKTRPTAPVVQPSEDSNP